MVSTDPIADMLTRVRNALAVHKTEVTMPHSRVKESVAKILQENGYITDISVEKDDFRKSMTLNLDGAAAIHDVSRISKPGRRIYAKVKDIPRVKQGRGIVIVSTSQGVLSGEDAREKKLGGELICEVY